MRVKLVLCAKLFGSWHAAQQPMISVVVLLCKASLASASNIMCAPVA